MDLGLKGRVALVCAASQGLGKAAAIGFAAEGAHTVMCARGRKRLDAAADDIRRTALDRGVSVLPIVADLTKPGDVRRLVARTIGRFGRIDILVTNAGGPPVGTFRELDDATWDLGIRRNLMSTVRCVREVLPHMLRRKWGRVINITSLTAKQPVDDLIISSTVRPGILGLSKILANQYGGKGITFNNVAPGYILTARQKEIASARAGSTKIDLARYMRNLMRDVPIGRFGGPEELASVIVFLGSEKASYVNGATISVDGGLVKGLF